MNHDRYDDAYIAGILDEVKTIAMVGASANASRPSYFAMKYLLGKGYTVIPVNPSLAGQQILGQMAVGTLADIVVPVDMVDIFRNSEAAGPITATDPACARESGRVLPVFCRSTVPASATRWATATCPGVVTVAAVVPVGGWAMRLKRNISVSIRWTMAFSTRGEMLPLVTAD